MAAGLVMASTCERSREATFAVPDSVGVEMVVTDVPLWDTEDAWRLGAIPTIQIGRTEGDAPYLFEDIRSAFLLDDGQLVVGDGLTKEIRFFDSGGSHLRTVGREGNGPGEFLTLDWMDACGEGIYVMDRRQRRVTSLGLDGELLGTLSLTEPGSERGAYRSGCGPGGRLLIAGWGELPITPPATGIALYRQDAPVWLVDPQGHLLVEVGEYISSERVYTINPLTGGRGDWPHPFGREVVFALDQERLYVGASERLQVEVRNHEGDLLRILRGPDVDLSIGPERISAYRSLEFARPDSILRGFLEDHDMPMPEGMPAYTRFVVDPMGDLWVERFDWPTEEVNRWGIFSADGDFRGHLDMPQRVRLMDVARDHVVGVSEDHLGVERVVVHRLYRN